MEGATRFETPGPDGAPLSLLLDNGPDRTGVCPRHAEGYKVALDIWEKAGRPVIDRRRPRTPEETELVRRFMEGARKDRSEEEEEHEEDKEEKA